MGSDRGHVDLPRTRIGLKPLSNDKLPKRKGARASRGREGVEEAYVYLQREGNGCRRRGHHGQHSAEDRGETKGVVHRGGGPGDRRDEARRGPRSERVQQRLRRRVPRPRREVELPLQPRDHLRLVARRRRRPHPGRPAFLESGPEALLQPEPHHQRSFAPGRSQPVLRASPAQPGAGADPGEPRAHEPEGALAHSRDPRGLPGQTREDHGTGGSRAGFAGAQRASPAPPILRSPGALREAGAW